MENKKQKSPEKDKQLRVEVMRQMLTLATSGFGLVAALAWNNVIQEFVNNYVKKFLPNGSGIWSLLIYALVITFLAVFVTYQLSKVLERISPPKN
jgi:hypothetical protein